MGSAPECPSVSRRQVVCHQYSSAEAWRVCPSESQYMASMCRYHDNLLPSDLINAFEHPGRRVDGLFHVRQRQVPALKAQAVQGQRI